MTPQQQAFLESFRKYMVGRLDRMEAKLDTALAEWKEFMSEPATTTVAAQPGTTSSVGGAPVANNPPAGGGVGTNKFGPVVGSVVAKKK